MKEKKIITKLIILLICIVVLLIVGEVTGIRKFVFGESKNTIEDSFVDFMTTFQSDNYEYLYDKIGDNSEFEEGDLGLWSLFTSMHYGEGEDSCSKSLLLVFNNNLKVCRGKFWIEDEVYFLSYENGVISFLDENIDESIKEELDDFPLVFDVINMDKPYLKTLKNIIYRSSPKPSSYTTEYYLPNDDINVMALKNAYKDFPFDDDSEMYLKLRNDGREIWTPEGDMEVTIYNRIESKVEPGKFSSNQFYASMSFRYSSKFPELFEEFY